MMKFLFALIWSAGGTLIAADFEAAQFVEYSPGNMPLILAVPHDGTESLPGVPERTGSTGAKNFNKSRDTNTALLARNVAAEIESRTGKRPYVVIMKLARKWVDPNRKEENAVEHPRAAEVYHLFYGRLADAKREILATFGKGLVLDVHCGGSWKHDVYFGTAKNRAIQPLLRRTGAEARTWQNGFAKAMSELGYEIPGFNSIPPAAGPTGNLIDMLTWRDKDNQLDGIEIEIQRKRHLHNSEEIAKFSKDFAAALLKFMEAHYL